MAGSVVEQIKERINIADVIGRYVNLKKSGKNSFGLCPFHSEKTPSFSVNSDLGIYKCFGCGESGDVISFIQKIEGMDFKQAIEFLGKEAGVKVDFSQFNTEDDKRQQRLYNLNKFAQRFFQYILMRHKLGASARDYIKKRKIASESIESFGIGYAPSLPNNSKIFYKLAKKEGWTDKELVDGGLVIDRNGKMMDKFRNRLIFSIYDLKGRIAGFSGRLIRDSDYAPKYLNSPETRIFHKGELMYGLYQGRNAVRQEDFAILVEGQTDVISSHQVGVKNIVAPLGTSLTEGHLKQIGRYTKTIAVSFDLDLAGENAVKRTVQIAHQLDFDVQAIPISKAKDVDELIQKSPSSWKKISKKPINIIDYMLKRLLDRINVSTVNGKVEVITELAPLIAAISNKLKKDYYINEISRQIDVEKDLIQANLAKTLMPSIPQIREEIKSMIASKSTLRQEEYFLGRLIQYPEIALQLVKKINMKMFSNPEYKEFIKAFMKLDSAKNISKVLKKMDKSLVERLSNFALRNINEDESPEDVKEELTQIILMLRERALKNELSDLNQGLAAVSNKKEKQEIMDKMKRVTKKVANTQRERKSVTE